MMDSWSQHRSSLPWQHPSPQGLFLSQLLSSAGESPPVWPGRQEGSAPRQLPCPGRWQAGLAEQSRACTHGYR